MTQDPESQPAGFQQPPSAPPPLRASNADRDAVVAIINRGLTEGRLTPAEHAQRVTRARSALTQPELSLLTADLVVIQDAHHADEVMPVGGAVVTPLTHRSTEVSAFMSTKQRQGTWLVPPQLNANSVMGTVKLDLREAVFETLDVTINLTCIMGEVKVWIPEGTQVVDETHSVLSEVKLKKLSPPRPGRPRIVFTGLVIMGDLIVYGSEYVSFADRVAGNF